MKPEFFLIMDTTGHPCYNNPVKTCSLSESEARAALGAARRVVVKIGSRVLVQDSGRPETRRFKALAGDIAALCGRKHEVVVVTSGAIGTGMQALGMRRRPGSLHELQMAAAVGQSRLMTRYDRVFTAENKLVGQVLLTHDDLKHRARHLNARNTIMAMLRAGVIPVINENDVVAVDEIKFGDNDLLAALVVHLIKADLLIMLTMTDGLIRPLAAGKSERIGYLSEISGDILKLARGKGGELSTGGMASKLESARLAMETTGSPVVIADGRGPGIIRRIMAGEDVGTLIVPAKAGLAAICDRKRWIAFFHRPKGALTIDAGACSALEKGGKSLLAIGVKKVEGDFPAGAVVNILSASGRLIARGLTTYSSREIQVVRGRRTDEIAGLLGSKKADELIHRDNLVLMNADA
ncbi:MAG: glutamate 5-kinase [Kiritimatiellae bacterium]|nr:glutamate 5-kinase [Kiritimatiellia bacterium]